MNNAPFRSCISKLNDTFIDNAEDLDIVMRMHNLLEYSENYSMTSGTLSQYYLDKINVANDNETIISKTFAYKTKTNGSTPDDDNTLETEDVFRLKYLSKCLEVS